MEKDIVVLDCGAGSLKVGLASDEQPRLVCPNLSFKSKGETRSFTGDALVTRDEILSLTLRRPFDRGYLVNPDLQREIITRVFNSVLEINPEQCGLVITEPPFNFESCRAELLKVRKESKTVFEGCFRLCSIWDSFRSLWFRVLSWLCFIQRCWNPNR